jgi:hypothetical protein
MTRKLEELFELPLSEDAPVAMMHRIHSCTRLA